MLKILALVAAIGALGGAGGGTLAAVIHGRSPARPPRVSLALATPGPANTLRVPGVALAAGDRMQRPVDVRVRTTAPITRVALTSTPVRSSVLDRDRVYGLRLRIDRCSRAWRRVAGRRYVCSGQRNVLLRQRPVVGYGVPLPGLANLPRTRVAHLLLTLTLPWRAPNAFQGKRSSMKYTFTAVQAARRSS